MIKRKLWFMICFDDPVEMDFARQDPAGFLSRFNNSSLIKERFFS